MALTITQVMDMGKKKPNQASPESTVWPIECFEEALLPRELLRLCATRKLGATGIHRMFFIRRELALGKQVELWDRNVHRVIQVVVPEPASAQRMSQLRH